MVLGSDLRRGNATGSTHRGPGSAIAAALVLVLATALTACSDDSGGGSEVHAPHARRRSGPTGRAPRPAAPADRAAAEKEIKENWQKFFDPKTSTEDKQAVLENGDRDGSGAPGLQR